MILFEKFRSSGRISRLIARPSARLKRYTRGGPLSRPGRGLLRSADPAPAAGRGACLHVFAAERLHGDDTTVPVLAKGKTDAGRLWTYVPMSATIDNRPFGGQAHPAAMFYSRAPLNPQIMVSTRSIS